MNSYMNITGITAYRLKIPLRQGYTIAYESYDSAENVLVRVTDADGHTGWGCAAPDPHVTGETVDNTLDVLDKTLTPLLLGKDSQPVGRILETVEQAVHEDDIGTTAPAARAALDMAVYDIWAKRLNTPLMDLLGCYRQDMRTFVTIGLCGLDETMEQARMFVDQGFRQLKVKGGHDPDLDIERIRALNKEYREDVLLCLDANQGYDLEEAFRVCREMRGLVAFMEQPVAAANRRGLLQLVRESPVSIMADEAASSVKETLTLFEAGVNFICVKLMKCGGLAPALRICHVARPMGRSVMISCMDELPVSMAAAACLALSQRSVAWADLDGHLDLDQDLVTGGLNIDQGLFRAVDAPGLGLEVAEDKIDAFRVL